MQTVFKRKNVAVLIEKRKSYQPGIPFEYEVTAGTKCALLGYRGLPFRQTKTITSEIEANELARLFIKLANNYSPDNELPMQPTLIQIGCNYHTKWQANKAMRFVLMEVKDGKARLKTRTTGKDFWTSVSDLIFIETDHNKQKANRLTKNEVAN